MARKKTGNQFEDSLKKLESIVEKMEEGELTLEESIQHFEEGVALSKHCQEVLDGAEQKIKILLQKNCKKELIDFEDATDNEQ